MYLDIFEEKLSNFVKNNMYSKTTKEFKIIKFKFGKGNAIKIKAKNDKIVKIEVKGSEGEKFLEKYKKEFTKENS